MGATMALPFLDAMVPAARTRREALTDPTRLLCIEEVHGQAGCNVLGAQQVPVRAGKAGRDFAMVPDSSLAAFEPIRDYMTIVSNTDVKMAEAFALPEIGGDHFRSSAVFLTQSHPKQTQGSDIWAGTSLDQMYAKRFGQASPMPSMQFCIENLDQAGGCTYNYSCVYIDAISWASPNEPLPMIRDPRMAFDMMFGAGGTPEARIARREARKSILDWINSEVVSLRKQLGTADRARIDRYLQNVAEIERRIKAVEARNLSGEARELPAAPPGVPDSYSEHVKLMFDIQVLAFESDLTRTISFKTGRDADNRVFPESGSSGAFHSASHHGGAEARVMDFNKICRYPHGPDYLSARQAQVHDGWGQEPAREDDGHVGLADGGLEPSQPPPLPARVLRARQRPAARQRAHQGRRRHADGQRDADGDAQARHGRSEVLWR
jgi:hypothetical protein